MENNKLDILSYTMYNENIEIEAAKKHFSKIQGIGREGENPPSFQLYWNYGG